MLLFLAFFLSGCSGLIYQTVWVRMLTRYVGATTYATATVLTVFMAGLALGSYLGGRYADRSSRPLRGYVVLELAIALTGLLASFAVIEGLGTFYASYCSIFADRPGVLLLVRIVFVMICLLPPTLLMGATLPLLVVFVSQLGEHLQAGLGRLYAINTFGAVVGVLAAGLFLIGELGERASLGVAASLNVAAAFFVLVIRQPKVVGSAAATANDPGEVIEPYPARTRRIALATMAISGFSALAYEILWTRLLVLELLTSIYAFSFMLGTFLVGIALGSEISSRWRRLRQAPLLSFGMLEILIGLLTAVGLVMLPLSNRFWLRAGGLAVAGTAYGEGSMVALTVGAVTCVMMVLPIAVLFGMQFPIAVRCCQAEPDAPGHSTGRAYAVNTVGTIAGAMSAGFVLVPLLGAATAMMFVAGLNVVMGVLLLFVTPAPERGRSLRPAIELAAIFVLLTPLVGDPYKRIMATRMHYMGPQWEIFRYYESATATTIAAGIPRVPIARALLVNGYGMTALCTETKLMAHLPYHLAQDPKRMLVICFGMGTTYRSACQYPELSVDAVDLVPEVFACFDEFHPDAKRWMNRPGSRLNADDGRSFLLTHSDPYDIITIDPPPPLYSAGAVNLYTKEFFQLCKDRLSSSGVFCMWLPPAWDSEARMILRSFSEVFPEATVWGGLEPMDGCYLIGGHRSFKQTPQQLAVLARQLSQIKELNEWKRTIDYNQPANLEKLYLTDAEGLAQLVQGTRPVTDDHPYTEFPLWRWLFLPQAKRLFTADTIREELKENHENTKIRKHEKDERE